jgi:hypothetical protein
MTENDNSNQPANDSKPSAADWQFSLRSVMLTVTGAAVFLSFCMTVPGLKELPYIAALTIAVVALCFAVGCLLGWLANRCARGRGGTDGK